MKLSDFHFIIFLFLINFGSKLPRASSDSKYNGYEYTSFIKGPGCKSLEPPRFPKTHQEVVAIVKEAISRGVKVKAYGARHSSTDIICTDGIPIDMHGIQDMSLDHKFRVTVGAGVTVGAMTEYLAKHGRGLPIIPAFQNITVGGAVGTGAHGSSLLYPASLSEQTVEFLIVDGTGKIRTIKSEDDLKSFRVHLGLLGIVLQLKFETIPLFKFQAHNYVVEEDILDKHAMKIGRKTDQILFYWFPSFKKVVVANWTRVDVKIPGNAKTYALIPPTTASFNLVGSRLVEAAQALGSFQFLNLFQYMSFLSLFTTLPDVMPIYTENGIHVENPAVGFYHRITSVSCREEGWVQCPWAHGKDGMRALDNEMAIDIRDFPAFVRRVKDILSRSPAVFPLEGILIRFSGTSTTHMSLSRGRDTCHIEFYPLERKNRYDDPMLGLASYQAIMQSLLNEFSGRSHWGKSGAYYHTAAQLKQKLDPAARAAFIQSITTFDPHGIFLNDFGRRLLGKSDKMNWDPLVTRCALLDHCICSSNHDCAPDQTCSRIDWYPNYPVCLPKPQMFKPQKVSQLLDLSWFTIY